jgi:hypothetical protein
MSDLAGWLDNNTFYLANAVAQVRTLLERHSHPGDAAVAVRPQTPPPEELTAGGWRLFGRRASRAVLPVRREAVIAAGATEAKGVVDSDSSESRSDPLAVGPAMEPPPALLILGERLDLSRFELQILLLCAALELDTRIAGLCARAQDDPGRTYPTFALALALFEQPAWEALSPERPLRRWRLIEINQSGALPLTVSPLRADERIVNYLKGLNHLDDRLAPLLTAVPVPEQPAGLPASQQGVVERIVRHFDPLATRRGVPVIQLLGIDAASKQRVAACAARALGLQVYRLPASLVPTQTAELESLTRLLRRERLLVPIALYLDASEQDGEVAHSAQAAAVVHLIERVDGVVFLGTRDVWPIEGKATVPLDVAKPDPGEQQAAWAAALGADADGIPARLAGQFNLDIDTIEQIAERALTEESEEADGGAEDSVANSAAHTAANEAPESQRALFNRIWAASLDVNRPRLDNLAQYIDTKATWEDIVLPSAESALLRQIADQVGQRSTVYDTWGFRATMSRGLGINALFAGGSGTGKTMAAEVLANHLSLSLYRIDLSAVVSKYIGESEKNLRRLFDAAEDAGCILFFDEADALFGKRSEVKDSHDRYANIEINYLLQRMEVYRGLAILATNMKSALDPAFLRRLRFVVNFPFPGVGERKAIWQKVFPAKTPTAGLDYDKLARLNLTGGHIHNIGLNAAFLAAKSGGAVTMPLILQAARAEFQKLDKAINEADFRWTGVTGAAA